MEPCAGVTDLKDMSGTIDIAGGRSVEGERVCSWHIQPDENFLSITFFTEFGTIAEGDRLILRAGGGAEVASFSKSNPLAEKQILSNVNSVVWTLHSSSENTRIKIDYTCEPLGPDADKLQKVLAMFVLGFFAIFNVICWISLVCFTYWERHQELGAILANTLVVPYALYKQSPRGNVEDEKEKEEEEGEDQVDRQRPAASQGTPRHDSDDVDECRICLEPYGPEDSLRVLPCAHYFHKHCIDTWFSSVKFRMRRCPLCNANLANARRFIQPTAPLAVNDIAPLEEDIDVEALQVEAITTSTTSGRPLESASAPQMIAGMPVRCRDGLAGPTPPGSTACPSLVALSAAIPQRQPLQAWT